MNTLALSSKKPFAAVLAAVVACMAAVAISSAVSAGEAWAGGQPGNVAIEDLGSSLTVSIKGGKDSGYRSYSSLKSPKKKIANAESSNDAVATVEANNFDGYYTLLVKAKKAGTTNISFTFGGKKKTVKYTVVKYANPVKTFKVGKNDYASKFAPKAMKKAYAGEYLPVGVKVSSLSGKVNLKLAKGWKVKKMWYWTGSGTNAKMKYFKNGQKISKAVTVYAWVQKGKQRDKLFLYCAGA